ncbi:MAG: hypothetical protein KGJ62_05700 [Armatimonadetes bacterium]|nr:hypothetical protein [Armatimonadota bacterium]MDE2205988.1 hypothetical protein [Armatimonadota bacterium]
MQRSSGQLARGWHSAGIAAIALIILLTVRGTAAGQLAANFKSPPASARPWVYWFWLNGNITKAGITTDLEAMKRVGVGGVLIMEVDQGVPVGPVAFAGPEWRALFRFVLSEAKRLGLKVDMNDDAGWCGSGGPWITPDLAMQRVVWTETPVTGPTTFDGVLKQPPTVDGYYRDIAVTAYPTPANYRIPHLARKTGLVREDIPPASGYARLPQSDIVPRNAIRMITPLMQTNGRIRWSVPAGRWTLLRMGYTPTGAVNAPAPATGRGLECDKLSKEGATAAFNGLIGRLIHDSPDLVGKSLVSMHIDSWEMGSQNWTARFPQEFLRRRGYDLTPYLPVLTGRVVGSLEQSERFLWDFRQTIAGLLAENYAGAMRKLAHSAGIRLSVEAYGNAVFDDVRYGGMADEPMTEFWSSPNNFMAAVTPEMVSAAHLYGRRIVGAEAFTAGDAEKWLLWPGAIKPLGDWAFCRGVNQFVIHRFAMQPWTDRAPGMSMGPWGLHYERTQTWWNLSKPWHEYLARCQYLLQKGLPVADILYLEPEGAPDSFSPPTGPDQHGYRSDICTADALLHRVTIRNGRLVLPDGMTYRLLVLPDVTTMTPALLQRVATLVDHGAVVFGPRPDASPGLDGYPNCDAEIRRTADRLWGSGKITDAGSIEADLMRHGIRPDFGSNRNLDFTHRTIGNLDVYFIANRSHRAVNADCEFRIGGKRPELWDPETGVRRLAAVYQTSRTSTRLCLRMEAAQSIFVVFRPATRKLSSHIVSIKRNGVTITPEKEVYATPVHVIRAVWGPAGDPARTKDVTVQVARLVASGHRSFVVANLASGGDPAVNVLKTLTVEYAIHGKRLVATATDPETVAFEQPADAAPALDLDLAANGALSAAAAEPGRYTLTTERGKRVVFTIHHRPVTLYPRGPWDVWFPPNSGAPGHIRLNRLISLSDYPAPGVRYFSGIATYRTTFEIPARVVRANRRITLDLGNVAVMARVTVNGKDLGILWHAPYSRDITAAVRAGANRLEIRVADLWPNRMIGDEQLPEDSPRQSNGTLAAWPQWLLDDKPSPSGRFTFTTWRLWAKNSTLPEAGLLGPVRLRFTPLRRLVWK